MNVARRVIGGTLMACGAAGALLLMLVTGWYVIELLSEIKHAGFGGPRELLAVLARLGYCLLAIGMSVLVAGVGRLILGARAAV